MFGFDNKQPDNSNTAEPAMTGTPPVSDSPAQDVSSSDLPMTPPEPSLPAAPAPVQNDTSMSSDDDLLPTDHAKDDLTMIKQDALQQLSPLVGHLEQSPEEKFKTTMMMIQASDDSSLISTAYEAAKNISDEKVRAQALLDIVNEINYFTQQSGSGNE